MSSASASVAANAATAAVGSVPLAIERGVASAEAQRVAAAANAARMVCPPSSGTPPSRSAPCASAAGRSPSAGMEMMGRDSAAVPSAACLLWSPCCLRCVVAHRASSAQLPGLRRARRSIAALCLPQAAEVERLRAQVAEDASRIQISEAAAAASTRALRGGVDDYVELAFFERKARRAPHAHCADVQPAQCAPCRVRQLLCPASPGAAGRLPVHCRRILPSDQRGASQN